MYKIIKSCFGKWLQLSAQNPFQISQILSPCVLAYGMSSTVVPQPLIHVSQCSHDARASVLPSEHRNPNGRHVIFVPWRDLARTAQRKDS